MFGVDGAEDESVAVLKPVIPPDAENGPCLRARVVRACPGVMTWLGHRGRVGLIRNGL